MVVDKRDGVPRSEVQQSVVKDGPQVIARSRLACSVEVVMQRDVKERNLRSRHDVSHRKG